jgi:hypothetical protein
VGWTGAGGNGAIVSSLERRRGIFLNIRMPRYLTVSCEQSYCPPWIGGGKQRHFAPGSRALRTHSIQPWQVDGHVGTACKWSQGNRTLEQKPIQASITIFVCSVTQRKDFHIVSYAVFLIIFHLFVYKTVDPGEYQIAQTMRQRFLVRHYDSAYNKWEDIRRVSDFYVSGHQCVLCLCFV